MYRVITLHDKFGCEENITLLYNISNTDLLVHLPQKIVETASRCSYPWNIWLHKYKKWYQGGNQKQ